MTVQWRIQDFPDGNANPWFWSENLLFGKIFAENDTKMKKKLDREGRGPHHQRPPPPPPPIHQCGGWLNSVFTFRHLKADYDTE